MNANTLASAVASPTASPTKRRLDYIDALRGAACLWILFHHSFQGMPSPKGILHYPSTALVFLSDIGWLGVSMFLVLSGFCLFYPLVLRYSLSDIKLNLAIFVRRRAMRILPPYYAAFVLLAALMITLHHSDTGRWDWHFALHGPKDIWMHLLMVHNLSADTIGSINGVFWSLALECQLYVIFPLLIWAAIRFGLKAMLAGTFLIAFSWQTLCFHHLGYSLIWTPRFAVYYHALPGRCFEFAAGMTAAYFVARPRLGQSRIALALILIPILPATYFVCFVSRFAPLIDQVWGIIFAATLVLLARIPDARFQQNIVLRGLVWVGAISYSVYLVHPPFVSLISPHLLHIQGSAGRNLFAGVVRLPMLVGIGYLFHLAFERPFMPGRPRTERQAEVAAALSPAP